METSDSVRQGEKHHSAYKYVLRTWGIYSLKCLTRISCGSHKKKKFISNVLETRNIKPIVNHRNVSNTSALEILDM